MYHFQRHMKNIHKTDEDEELHNSILSSESIREIRHQQSIQKKIQNQTLDTRFLQDLQEKSLPVYMMRDVMKKDT